MRKVLKVLLIAILFASCKDNSNNDNQSNSNVIPTPAILSYTVFNVHPHDTSSFTEGLIWLNSSFLESTGEYKRSYLLKVNPQTGKAEKKYKLADKYFGEGITVLNNKIYQLTYQEHKVFVYDMNFNKLSQEFEWPYEGWGMTTDGKYLIIDTGGSNLYFVNPETFKIERTLGVVNNNGYVSMINELEYVDGYLYANIYLTNYIIKINAQTGLVEAKADLTDILKSTHPEFNTEKNVLNGIAYNAEKKTFYITGKNWPNLFEVQFH